MKKNVKIEMYYDCTDEWGVRHWNYVCSMWGDHIEFDQFRWYLFDSADSMICCGNISELHGIGSDDFDVKLKSVVRY